MIGRDDIEAALQEIGAMPDDAIELGETALLLASLTRPRVGLERYRDHLEALAREVGDVDDGDAELPLERRLAALGDVIAGANGYHGDSLTYDDVQNANMIRVIDRRKGLPITLGILYIHAARAQGWACAGVNFPGHFLVRLDAGNESAMIDPFEAGVTYDAAELRALLKATAGTDAELHPEHTQPATNRAVLVRLQNNIKVRYEKMGRLDDAARILDSMLTIAPGETTLWYERGALDARRGRLGSAIEALETFMEKAAPGDARHEAATLLQRLRRSLN